MDIQEALDEFRAEYESSEHWGSDLIISFECAETILSELDKDNNIISDLQNEVTLKQCELDKKDKIINEYEKECKKTRAFARRIRKDEKRDIDQFNQGKEFASIQFLNLLANEPHWDYEGKYFDEVDREIGRYLKKAEGN